MLLQKRKMEEEMQREIDRMYMEREDRQSRLFNEALHRQRFSQKDAKPPALPECLLQQYGLKNVPV